MSIEHREAVEWTTMLQFSEALNLMDQGDFEAARTQMELAVQRAPRFEAALAELDDLDALIESLQDQRSTGLPLLVLRQIEALSTLDPEVCNTFRYSYKGMVQELIDAESSQSRVESELSLYQLYASLQILLDAELTDSPCGNISPNEAAMGAFIVQVMNPRMCSKSDLDAQERCVAKAMVMRDSEGVQRLHPKEYEALVLTLGVDYLERFPAGQEFSQIKSIVNRIQTNRRLRGFVAEKRVGGVLDQFEYSMIVVRPGTFLMGLHPDRIPDEIQGFMSNPEVLKNKKDEIQRDLISRQYLKMHEVTLSHELVVGATEVPQALYESVMKDNPSRHVGPERPVDSVSWYKAIEFCNRLSNLEGLEPVYLLDSSPRIDMTANGYRLLTEAEWEYVARAGESNDGEAETDAYTGWFDDNSGGVTHPVGTLSPNSWGFHDLMGNVMEWTFDMHPADRYAFDGQPDLDPYFLPGHQTSTADLDHLHSARGGSFGMPAALDVQFLDALTQDPKAFRWTHVLDISGFGGIPIRNPENIGFRIARVVSHPIITVQNVEVKPEGPCSTDVAPVIEVGWAPVPRFQSWKGHRWWRETTADTWPDSVGEGKDYLAWPLSRAPFGMDVVEMRLTDGRVPSLVTKKCYREALARNESLSGTIEIVGQAGMWEDDWVWAKVEVTRNTTNDEDLARCVAVDLTRWRIRWESTDVDRWMNRGWLLSPAADNGTSGDSSFREPFSKTKHSESWCQSRQVSFTLDFERQATGPDVEQRVVE